MSLILQAAREYLKDNGIYPSDDVIDNELFVEPNLWIYIEFNNIHISQTLYMNGPYNPSWDISPEDPQAFPKLLQLIKDRVNK